MKMEPATAAAAAAAFVRPVAVMVMTAPGPGGRTWCPAMSRTVGTRRGDGHITI